MTPRGRPGEGKKRKRKRKRERDRERLRRRGGLAESDKKVLEEENATMRAKLADRWDKLVQSPFTVLMLGCLSEKQEREEKWPCRTDWQSLLDSRRVLVRKRRRVEGKLLRRIMGRGAKGEAGGG